MMKGGIFYMIKYTMPYGNNPPGRKKGEREHSQYVISNVMCKFIEYITGLKKRSIQTMFSRKNKKLTDYKDVREFIQEHKKNNF